MKAEENACVFPYEMFLKTFEIDKQSNQEHYIEFLCAVGSFTKFGGAKKDDYDEFCKLFKSSISSLKDFKSAWQKMKKNGVKDFNDIENSQEDLYHKFHKS